MHGARVVALRGNFDQALALVRQLVDGTRSRSSTRSTTTASRARRPGPSRSATSSASRPTCSASRSATPATSPRGGRASRRRARRRGCTATRPRGPPRSCTAARSSSRRRSLRAIRIGNPARWEDAMNAFTASRGEIRAVSDAEILDAYELLGAARGRVLRAGVGGGGGGAAEVRRRGPRGVRAHRPRPEGPADRDEPRGAASCPASRSSTSVERALLRMKRHRVVRVPASSANLGPGYDVLAAALSLDARAGGGGDGRAVRVSCDVPGVPLDRTNLCVRAFEALHPADGLTFHIRSEIPVGRRARVERGGDRRRALRRRPHVRARRAAVRAGARARGAPRQRGRGAARRVRDLRAASEPARFDPPAGLEARAGDPARPGAHGRRARGDAGRGAARPTR